MSTTDIVARLQDRKTIQRIQEAGITHLRLFGSGAIDKLQDDSDIDLLYDFDPQKIEDGRGVRGLYTDLKEILGYPVELVQKQKISQGIQANVFNSMISIF